MQKEIVIDGKDHLVGKLAAICAKQILEGRRITVIRCEHLLFSGPLYRNKLKFMSFLRKKSNTNPGGFSQKHHRSPSKIFKRALRGMTNHKRPTVRHLLNNMKAYEGVPTHYQHRSRVVAPKAVAFFNLKPESTRCKLGELATSVGWTKAAAVTRLEEKRRIRDSARFEKAKAANAALKAKRAEVLASMPAEIVQAYNFFAE